MLLSLIALSFPQEAPIEFGWHKPTWDYAIPSNLRHRAFSLPDLRGDGVAEVLATFDKDGIDHIHILNGATGQIWASVSNVGPDYSQEYFFHDLDGDGLQEFIVSNYVVFNYAGTVKAVHGGDGALMWEHYGRELSGDLGKEIYFQDIDGDGLSEVLLGTKDKGKLFALDGISGLPKWSILGNPHRFFVQAPDLDGDGITDLVVGGQGHVTAFSAQTGHLLWNTRPHLLTDPKSWLHAYGDVNGDGVADVFLSNPDQDHSGPKGGAIEVRDGTSGELIWSTSGVTGDQLGSSLHVEDWTNDGVPDLFTTSGKYSVLFDGSDGSELWSKRLPLSTSDRFKHEIHDVTGDGNPDIVVQYERRAKDTVTLAAWHTQTGAAMWEHVGPYADLRSSDLFLIDLDANGQSEIMVIHPNSDHLNYLGGFVNAHDGSNGQLLWAKEGLMYERIGYVYYLAEIDNLPGVDIVLCTADGDLPRSRFALNGATGAEIWRQEYAMSSYTLAGWAFADIDGDQVRDIVEFQEDYNWGILPPRVQLINALTGESHGVMEAEPSRWIEVFDGLGDSDGDGAEEIVLYIEDKFYDGKLFCYSTSTLGWTSGVTTSTDALSASAGGQIDIELDLPSAQSGWDYQMLLSNEGQGPTTIDGLVVPLSRSYLLSTTYLGIYPGAMFQDQIGTLNSDGDATIYLTALPHEVPASLVGNSVYVAVLTGAPGADWEFSSGSSEIEIVP